MLNETQIRALVYQRMGVLEASCNFHHRTKVEGQIEALLAVLTEDRPPVIANTSTETVYQLAKIPFTDEPETLLFSDETLASLGFDTNGENHQSKLPVFGPW